MTRCGDGGGRGDAGGEPAVEEGDQGGTKGVEQGSALTLRVEIANTIPTSAPTVVSHLAENDNTILLQLWRQVKYY